MSPLEETRDTSWLFPGNSLPDLLPPVRMRSGDQVPFPVPKPELITIPPSFDEMPPDAVDLPFDEKVAKETQLPEEMDELPDDAVPLAMSPPAMTFKKGESFEQSFSNEYIKRFFQETTRAGARSGASTIGTALQGIMGLITDDPTKVAQVERDMARINEMSDEEYKIFDQYIPFEARINPLAAAAYQSAAHAYRRGDRQTADNYLATAKRNLNLGKVEDTAAYKLGERITKYSQGPQFQPQQGYTKDSIAVQLGEGGGSMMVILPLAFVPGAGGVLSGTASVAMGAGEAMQNTKLALAKATRNDRGSLYNSGYGSEAAALTSMSAKMGTIPGVTDVMPVETLVYGLAGRIPWLRQFAGSGMWHKFAKAAGQIALQAGIEGGQEGGQQYLQNLITKLQADPGQDLNEGFWRSVLIGGAVGGIAQAPVSAYEAAFPDKAKAPPGPNVFNSVNDFLREAAKHRTPVDEFLRKAAQYPPGGAQTPPPPPGGPTPGLGGGPRPGPSPGPGQPPPYTSRPRPDAAEMQRRQQEQEDADAGIAPGSRPRPAPPEVDLPIVEGWATQEPQPQPGGRREPRLFPDKPPATVQPAPPSGINQPQTPPIVSAPEPEPPPGVVTYEPPQTVDELPEHAEELPPADEQEIAREQERQRLVQENDDYVQNHLPRVERLALPHPKRPQGVPVAEINVLETEPGSGQWVASTGHNWEDRGGGSRPDLAGTKYPSREDAIRAGAQELIDQVDGSDYKSPLTARTRRWAEQQLAAAGGTNAPPNVPPVSPQTPEAPQPTDIAEPPASGGWRPIGRNAEGGTVFEDERGVRSIVENGVRITESVGMRPVRGGGFEIEVPAQREPRFSPVEQAPAPAPTQAPTPTPAPPPPAPKAPKAGAGDRRLTEFGDELINAYKDRNKRDAFLKDAQAYLTAVNRILKSRGFTGTVKAVPGTDPLATGVVNSTTQHPEHVGKVNVGISHPAGGTKLMIGHEVGGRYVRDTSFDSKRTANELADYIEAKIRSGERTAPAPAPAPVPAPQPEPEPEPAPAPAPPPIEEPTPEPTPEPEPPALEELTAELADTDALLNNLDDLLNCLDNP